MNPDVFSKFRRNYLWKIIRNSYSDTSRASFRNMYRDKFGDLSIIFYKDYSNNSPRNFFFFLLNDFSRYATMNFVRICSRKFISSPAMELELLRKFIQNLFTGFSRKILSKIVRSNFVLYGFLRYYFPRLIISETFLQDCF